MLIEPILSQNYQVIFNFFPLFFFFFGSLLKHYKIHEQKREDFKNHLIQPQE